MDSQPLGRGRRRPRRAGRGRAAQAQTKPFQVVGAGVGPEGLPLPGQDPRPHWAVEHATQLGKYYGEGSVETLTADLDPDTGIFTGTFQSGSPFEFEGANGDVLACDYGHFDKATGDDKVGTFTLMPTGEPGEYVAFWIADFARRPGAPASSAGSPAGGPCTPSPSRSSSAVPTRWPTRGRAAGR